jgi:hypothetical protein
LLGFRVLKFLGINVSEFSRLDSRFLRFQGFEVLRNKGSKVFRNQSFRVSRLDSKALGSKGFEV